MNVIMYDDLMSQLGNSMPAFQDAQSRNFGIENATGILR